MIDTILFDLDGTLLHFSQDDFINAYFTELGKVFVGLGMDAGPSVKAVWAGTKAMIKNDGSRSNSERFWADFAEYTGLAENRLKAVEAACDAFYVNEFNKVKSMMIPNDVPKRLVHALAVKGYKLVLATNPLFPACAVETRLNWIGLESRDFILVTHYTNSTFCKPNPGYYREVFKKTGSVPEKCLMAGNNPVEDMSAGALGAETFLVTDCLENETNADITAFRRGTLAELEEYLVALPDIN
ncbi:MAG: HAD family hydrolase [Defluviitaleaceae bacterium]|nr:HAD family hydrolase [Defluviitaleaceae bacterium]MCL2836374.1 HAD family hydrolase [Defluviitaleaceae bacterium]